MKKPNTVGKAGGEKGWHAVCSTQLDGSCIYSVEHGYDWRSSKTVCTTPKGAFDHLTHAEDMALYAWMWDDADEARLGFLELLTAAKVTFVPTE
jgi:hypothetical protein